MTGRTPLNPHDFYNPFMAASLVDPKGNKVPIWSTLGDGKFFDSGSKRVQDVTSGVGGGRAIKSLAFLQQLQVETNLGNYPIMKAILKPTYEDGLAILDSPLIEWGASTLEVQFGYIFGAGTLATQSPIWRGLLLQPNIDIGPEITITLNAQGIGAFSMERHEGGLVKNGETRKEIINALVKKQNQSEISKDITIDFEAAEADTTSKELLEEKVCYVQGYRTDLQSIWDLVRESQCWITFEESVIKVVPRGALSSEPKLDLALYGSKGVENAPPGTLGPSVRTFPILNASSPTMAVYLPASTLGLTAAGINSRKTAFETKVLKPEQAATGADGNKSDQSESLSEAGTPIYHADYNNPRAEKQAVQELERSRTGMGIRLEIDTLGVPDVLPGDTVHVSGLGARLTGSYGVFNTVHVFGMGGYTTSLTLVSNTSPLFKSGTTQALNPNIGKVPKADKTGTKEIEPK